MSKTPAKLPAKKATTAKKAVAKKTAVKVAAKTSTPPAKKATKKTAAKAVTTPLAKKAPAAAKRAKAPGLVPAKASIKSPPAAPTRFAHPFFTSTPVDARSLVTGVGTRLLDHIQANIKATPPQNRATPYTLAEIIGQAGSQEIEASGTISFHTVGDTGRGSDTPQGIVAEAMTADFDVTHPAACPAFFFHLGDVCYGHNKDQGYRTEFYEPYVHYPGKIVAIPGNHDGETFATTDPDSLRAFLANFCAESQTVPAIAGTIYRTTMNQPGVYYLLDAPFVQIVAMYSNAAENPGFISGSIPGPAQKAWLLKTLQDIAAARAAGTRKALIFATHHPPFTSGGHSPSVNMMQDIDSICQQAGIQPDMFLSGHAHSYQRYTRRVPVGAKTLEIPYLVVGTGGVGDQAVPPATGQVAGDHTYVKSYKGFGYLLVKVSPTAIVGTMIAVDQSSDARSTEDSFTVDLAKNKVV